MKISLEANIRLIHIRPAGSSVLCAHCPEEGVLIKTRGRGPCGGGSGGDAALEGLTHEQS